MSKIDIPPEYVQAYGHIQKLHYQSHDRINVCTIAACIAVNGLVWAIAGWMRSEFELDHVETKNIDTESQYRSCRVCGLRPVWDLRHFWAEFTQWQDAARVRLEGE